MGSQDGRSGATVGRDVVDEQRVELAAGRVALIHVQRLEVVPVGLDLGPFGDLEAQPDEHVLQALPRLGHEVGVPPPRLARVLGQIEPFGRDTGRECGVGELARRVSIARSTAAEGLVDGLAGGPLLVDGRERAESGLQLRQLAALAEQAGAEQR